MSDKPRNGGLHIDSDWKEEAAREKERLAAQEQRERRQGAPAGTEGAAAGAEAATFADLINMLALQATVGLGGFQGPGGERIPPNPAAAKHHIDLLDVVQKKTQGNLTDDEQRILSAVMYELRMQYIQTVTGPPPPTGKNQGKK